VPVEVAGLVPIGPINLDVRLSLQSYTGTPLDFGPLPAEGK
jgi:hypothetical protein